MGVLSGGAWVPYRVVIQRHGTGAKPTFKLRNNATIWLDGTDYASYMYLLHTPGHLKYVRVLNVKLDCNGPGQTTYVQDNSGPTGIRKVGGMELRGYDVTVQGCEVFSFLGKTQPNDNSGEGEVFPLILKGFNQVSASKLLVNLTVRDCFVHDLHRINNGYCTAINILTLTDDFNSMAPIQDDVYDDSHSSSSSSDGAAYLCFVEDNVVRCIFGGIGLGGRSLQRAVFRRNRVSKASVGFNLDSIIPYDSQAQNTNYSYKSRVVTIEDNEFEDLETGISIGAAGQSDTSLVNTWWIRNNSFILRGLCPYANPPVTDTTNLDTDEVSCEAYALRLGGGTGNIEFAFNNIGSVHDSSYVSPSSSTCDDENSLPSGDFYLGVKRLSGNDTPSLHDNKDQANNSLANANAQNKKILPN